MADLNALRDAIAAEKQQFQDFKTAKEGEINGLNETIAQKDARIAELEAQVANPTIPDDILTETGSIVP